MGQNIPQPRIKGEGKSGKLSKLSSRKVVASWKRVSIMSFLSMTCQPTWIFNRIISGNQRCGDLSGGSQAQGK